jgi:hypothetical protein
MENKGGKNMNLITEQYKMINAIAALKKMKGSNACRVRASVGAYCTVSYAAVTLLVRRQTTHIVQSVMLF